MTSHSNLSHTLPHLYYTQHEPLQLACPTSTNTTHSINTLPPLYASFTLSNHLHSTHLSPIRRNHIESHSFCHHRFRSHRTVVPVLNTHSHSTNTSTRPPRRRHAGALPSRLHHTPRPQPSSGHGICAHLLWISTHRQSSHSHLTAISQPSHSHLTAISQSLTAFS